MEIQWIVNFSPIFKQRDYSTNFACIRGEVSRVVVGWGTFVALGDHIGQNLS